MFLFFIYRVFVFEFHLCWSVLSVVSSCIWHLIQSEFDWCLMKCWSCVSSSLLTVQTEGLSIRNSWSSSSRPQPVRWRWVVFRDKKNIILVFTLVNAWYSTLDRIIWLCWVYLLVLSPSFSPWPVEAVFWCVESLSASSSSRPAQPAVLASTCSRCSVWLRRWGRVSHQEPRTSWKWCNSSRRWE